MIIRKAVSEDAFDLIPLCKNGNDMHYKKRPDKFTLKDDERYFLLIKGTIEAGYNIFLVAIDDEKFIGYIEYTIIEKIDKVAYINQFYVEDEYRKKGVGKALMDEVEKEAMKNKCSKIELNCWSFNQNALDFYYHLGYNNQRVILEKELNNGN